MTNKNDKFWEKFDSRKAVKITPTEHQIQAAFFDWVARQRIPGIELMHATPNGGKRTSSYGGKLKAEGMMRGVPDVSWPVSRGAYVGLAIEFKSDGANPTKEQRERIDALQKEGWCVVLCWSWEAATKVVQGYAGMMTVNYG